MKKLAVGLLVIALLLAGCASRTAAITPAYPPASLSPGGVVNVEDLMNNPDAYKGPILVEGVVSTVSLEQKIIGLIDTREFAECDTTDCSSLTLPVQWSGAMPGIEDNVKVSGEVQNSGGKFTFIARTLDIVKPAESSNGA